LLKLYTSIDASKLSAFVGAEDEKAGEEEVLQQIMALKNASRSYLAASAFEEASKEGREVSLLDGKRQAINNMDFTVQDVSVIGYLRL
jgi:translation initiation factor 3 subunit L